MQLPLIILTLVAILNHGANGRSPSKIVGGKRVDITEASFMVMIRHNSHSQNMCGGAIIGSRHILTAANCFTRHVTNYTDPYHPVWYYIVAGEDSYCSDAKKYLIEEVYSHPNYTPRWVGAAEERADIAVIKLKEEIPLSSSQEAIPLAQYAPAVSTRGLMYGWGRTHWNITTESHPLQGLLVKIADLQYCMENWPVFHFTKDELCVSLNADSGDCKGDSGGPFVVYGEIAGVISHGCLYCNGEIPSGISNVAYHKSWIEDAVKGTANAIKYFTPNDVDTTHGMKIPGPSPPQRKPRRRLHDELSARPSV